MARQRELKKVCLAYSGGLDTSVILHWLREEYVRRRNYMYSRLQTIPNVSCHRAAGAFYLFPNISGVCESLGAIEAHAALAPDLREKSSPATLFQLFLLWRYHVATLDRASFGRIGSEGQHYLRISIATALDELRGALDRIGAAARDREGFRAFVAAGEHLS